MKISIVIPVYQVEPFIHDCIQSVMRQTWQGGELECIFVDDRGTDNSMEVVHKAMSQYQGTIQFRIVVHDRNRGLSAARNSGIEAATGDYIFFLDSDDEISQDCIEVLSRPLEKERYDMTIGDYRVVGEGMPQIPLNLYDGQILRDTEVVHAYREKDWFMMSVNKLYRTSFLRENSLRFREGIIHEDELWSFQVACLARSMAVVRRETYIYKLREGSITVREFTYRRAESLNIILREMCVFSKRYGLQKDRDVHNIIQNFRIDCLHKVRKGAPDMFRDFYCSQRRMMSTSWVDCFRVNGCDLKKQVRDLHILMPLFLAIPYLRVLLQYYDNSLSR